MVASDQPGGRRFLRGLGLACRARGGLDVEVLQDVVVDLGGDLLLLQHLLDGLVGGARPDGLIPPRGSSGLSGQTTWRSTLLAVIPHAPGVSLLSHSRNSNGVLNPKFPLKISCEAI